MIVDHEIQQGMTLPSYPFTFSGSSGRTLAGATVRFVMADPLTGAAQIDAPAVIEDATLKQCRYDFASSDTAGVVSTPGRWKDFYASGHVLHADGKTERFPTQGYAIVRVWWAL